MSVGLVYSTQLVVRRAGMWPSSRSAEKPANAAVTSPAANHVHFTVQNPTAHAIAWSKEAVFNMILAIDVTVYTWRHQRTIRLFERPPSNR